MSWFQRLFGFEEPLKSRRLVNIPALKSSFEVSAVPSAPEGFLTLTSKSNGRSFPIGRFRCLNVKELRDTALERTIVRDDAFVIVNHVVVDDLVSLHRASHGACFQAASQFNCLEFPDSDVIPERGITNYMFDRTQGPACAIACAAGTVYRNYFAPVRRSNGEMQEGQTQDAQLNNLDDLEERMNNSENKYWSVTNGYTFSTKDGLMKLHEKLRSARESDEIDSLRDLIKVGVHENTSVNCESFDKPMKLPTPNGNESVDELGIRCRYPKVTQIYCSALSIAYSGFPAIIWTNFAKLILEANYEATLWAALACPPEDDRNEVYLTFVGGGVFGNEMAWIAEAIARAVNVVASHHRTLTVNICHYRSIKTEIAHMINSKLDASVKVVSK